MTIIIGIDPGSRITGYGVVAMEKARAVHLTSGCIEIAELAFEARLCVIFDAITAIVREFEPTEAAVEKIFMNRNADSAIKLGQARGAALVALAKQGLAVHEYSPNQIKQAIVGRGHAEKAQVQHMIKALLSLSSAPKADAADALATAMCHGHTQQGLVAVRSARRARAGRYS
ncbi:MAG: crossover junction endodeoxyribonuclease RuvC [Gammaproteobacteria bacterium]|nr:crossover junction endodeoxyribonuclease RuvC [Gammaproteobacteria bacterium]